MSDTTTKLSEYITENFGANASYVEGLLSRFQADPNSVDESWRTFFGDLLSGNGQSAATQSETRPVESQISSPAIKETAAAAKPAAVPTQAGR